MKKLLVLFCCLIFASNIAFADTVYPSNARYVIVNPNDRIKAATTFLLDTKTGKIWQLVVDSNNCNYWQQMDYDWYKQDGTWGGKTLKAPILTNP